MAKTVKRKTTKGRIQKKVMRQMAWEYYKQMPRWQQEKYIRTLSASDLLTLINMGARREAQISRGMKRELKQALKQEKQEKAKARR